MTSQGTGTGTVVGSLRAVDGKAVVRMEDNFDTDANDLWSAVTDPQRLARWVAQVDGDLRLGGSFRATFTSGWEGPGRVDVCEPPRRLVVTMSPGAGRPDGHRGRARSRWRPDPSGPGGARAAPERGGRARRRMAGPCRGSRRAPGRPPGRGLADPMDRTDPGLSRPAGPSRLTHDKRTA